MRLQKALELSLTTDEKQAMQRHLPMAQEKGLVQRKQRLQAIGDLKDDGKRYIGRRDYAKALECYSKALEQLKPLGRSDEQVKELLHLLPVNMALCYTQLERFEEAVSSMARR